jgi:hypothetical protein
MRQAPRIEAADAKTGGVAAGWVGHARGIIPADKRNPNVRISVDFVVEKAS